MVLRTRYTVTLFLRCISCICNGRSQNCGKLLTDLACLSSCPPPPHPHETTWLPIDRFSWNLIFEHFCNICRKKNQFSLKVDENYGYFTWGPVTYLITSRSVLLWIRNVSDKRFRRPQNPHFMSSYIFFLCENRAVHEIRCKNIVRPWRLQMTIWRTRIECWVPKATDTHSEYVTHCFSQRKQWLQERASISVICTLTLWLCVL